MDRGFIDLRPNRGETGNGDSLWPSFTDIMMVVVMIFLLATAVLIVRNEKLIAELRASLAVGEQALTAAASAEGAYRNLEAQFVATERELSEQREANLSLIEENSKQREQMALQAEQLLTLEGERSRLASNLDETRQEAELTAARLAEVQEGYEQLGREGRPQQERLQDSQMALAQLDLAHQQTLAELSAARQEQAAAGEKLKGLETEYGVLEEKYQALLRPARSAEGKQVAEVRYWRRGGATQVAMRGPGDSEFTTVDTAAMHERLAALKAQHGPGLYVKVIIPPESGLFYSEAWEFTRLLLNSYDYYYQDQALPSD